MSNRTLYPDPRFAAWIVALLVASSSCGGSVESPPDTEAANTPTAPAERAISPLVATPRDTTRAPAPPEPTTDAISIVTKKVKEITDAELRRRRRKQAESGTETDPFDLPSNTRPKQKAGPKAIVRLESLLPRNKARYEGDKVVVRWRIEHNCGKKPVPREEVTPGQVKIEVDWTGELTRCGTQWTMFRTVVDGLPPGQIEVLAPDFRTTVDVPSARK